MSWLEHFDQHGFWSLAKWTQLLSAFKAVCKIDTQLGRSSGSVWLVVVIERARQPDSHPGVEDA